MVWPVGVLDLQPPDQGGIFTCNGLFAGMFAGDVNKIYAALSGHKRVQDTNPTNLLQGSSVSSQESDFKSFF